MQVTIIILWVIWGLLLLAWPSDMLMVFFRGEGEPQEPDRNFVMILSFVGIASLCVTFLLKWFLFRFLIHPKRVGIQSPWAVVIFLLGSLTIWGLTKSVETYGLVIFFGSETLIHYLFFWFPSLLIMLIHMPFLLDPRRAESHRSMPEESGKPSPEAA
ncbi:MAG: hypothetical protein AAGC68_01305 [Verrucomicrobiota bacterium]